MAIVRPLQGRPDFIGIGSAGCTYGYSQNPASREYQRHQT